MIRVMITMTVCVVGAIGASFAALWFMKLYLKTEQKKIYFVLFCAAIGALGGFLFSKYDYEILEIARRFLVIFTVIAVAKIDQKQYIIPNPAVLFLFGMQTLLLLLQYFVARDEWLTVLFSSFLGFLIAVVTFLAGYLISRKGMGLGDVKLLAALGFCLGDSSVMCIILLSLLLSAGYSVVQMLRKKIKAKDEIAFAPFVAVAAVTLLLLGF